MKSICKIMFATCLAGLALAASAEGDMSYLKDVKGEMTAYCSNEPEPCDAVMKAFNAAVAKVNGKDNFTGKQIRLSTSEMISRVKSELEKSKAAAKRKCGDLVGDKAEQCKEKVYKSKVDIAYYGTDDPYKAALEDDIFAQHDYPMDSSVKPWSAAIAKSSGNRLGGLYLGVLGLGVNTELLTKYGVEKPVCWKDLEKPEYKGRIVMANWNTSGTAYKFAATILQAYPGGEAAGWDAVRGVHKNIAQYTKSGSKGGKMAARGETLIGVSFGHDIINLKQKGFPIDLVVPCEGTLFEIGPVGIIRGAKNRNAAEAFAKFLYEPSTQNILAEHGALQFPSNVNSKLPKGAETLTDVKLIDPDPRYSGKKVKSDIIKKWTEEVFPLPR